MDEKPKSIWEKSFTGRTALIAWLAVAALTIMLGCFIIALVNYNWPMSGWLSAVGLVAGGLLVACLILIYVVWPLLRWLFWKHWRRTLFGLACFATLIALFYAEEDWRGKHDWEKFKREWEAKGEHFDYASIIPPPVQDDQNFALTPIVASCYEYILDKNGHKLEKQNTNVVNRLAISREGSAGDWKNWPTNGYWLRQTITDLRGWQQFYRVLAAKTNEFPVPAQPQTPAQDVLLALSKYDSVIEELRQASQLPYSRFPLNYDADFPGAVLLPHLAALKRCVQVLQLRALAELQNRQSEKALDDVKLMLRLTDSIRMEPFLICHLVRIAMVNIAIQPVYEGLAEHEWSDAQLGELDQALAKIDFLTDYGVAMRGERALGTGVIDFLQHKRSFRKLAEVFNGMDGNQGDDDHSLEPITTVIIYRLSPGGWFDQNKLRIARFETKWNLLLADAENKIVFPKAAENASYACTMEVGATRTTPYNWLEKKMLPSLASAIKKFASAQSSVDLARVAIALERYRLAHGEFPESLDALAPQFIAQVPHDVIGGQPLKYRREANGQFILYSVGWNEMDDGGVVVFKKGSLPDVNPDQGDWVWRYPKKE